MTWLRQLLDWQREVPGAEEFVESFKTDVFKNQVFVYTPKGDLKELPAGATALDFAYRIHTDIGHRCIGAKVNDKLVPLHSTLQNGGHGADTHQQDGTRPQSRLAEHGKRLPQGRLRRGPACGSGLTARREGPTFSEAPTCSRSR